MQTNIEEADKEPSLAITVAKLVAVWLVFAVVVCALGGGFSHGPKDIPAGMSWVNSEDASSSTFYVLRDGPHLILDLNKHAMLLMTVLFCGFMVFAAYLSWQGFRGQVKDRSGEMLTPGKQLLMGVAMAVLVLILGYFNVGNMLLHQRLDLDPASDMVSMNGQMLTRFQDIQGFRGYETHGGKGGTQYHLLMEISGAEPVALGGHSPNSDVEPLATRLNGYLAEVRRQAPAH
jgi:hypothetical protein